MERLFEMQERAQEAALEQEIRSQISTLGALVTHCQLASVPAMYPPYPPWIQTPQSFWPMPAPAPIPAPIPAPTLAPTAAAPTTILATVVAKVSDQTERRSSSPIAEEEELVIADYWVWKGGQTSSINKKAQLAAVHEIVDEEMWTISQLKLMSDTSSKIFALAISKGILSGLAAGF